MQCAICVASSTSCRLQKASLQIDRQRTNQGQTTVYGKGYRIDKFVQVCALYPKFRALVPGRCSVASDAVDRFLPMGFRKFSSLYMFERVFEVA
jgi:hypothetical protein